MNAQRKRIYDWQRGINESDPAEFYVSERLDGDRDGSIIAWCEEEADAEKIANALNAAEKQKDNNA